MTNLVKFAFITGSYESICKDLNNLDNYCSEIKVLNSTVGIDQFNRTVILMLIKMDFNEPSSFHALEDNINDFKTLKFN